MGEVCKSNPEKRDNCVKECLEFMDTIVAFLHEAPNGFKSFKSKNEFEGIVNHMLGLEILYGGKRKIRNIISDPAKYTSAWLAAHETLKPNKSKGVKSEYGYLLGRKLGWEWRMKFYMVMDYIMNNGGLSSISIKPKVDSKRKFHDKDKTIAWDRQEGVCAHCEEDLNWISMHAHHKIPHGNGGPSNAENCELLHPDCHSQQHSGVAELVA